MLTTLNTYPNLYFDAQRIPAFTVVEIYKDTIAQVNSLGYCIVPINGVSDIKALINQRVAASAPAGYTTNVILAGRQEEGFDHRITYCVWYNGAVPTFPEMPENPTPTSPAAPFDRFNLVTCNNLGAATDVTLTLSIVAPGLIELYINNDLFSIYVKKLEGNKTLVIDKTGVNYNSKNIDSFIFSTTPCLKNGENIIKLPKDKVSNIKINYKPKY